MRIETTAVVAGLPVLQVRRFLRETMHVPAWYRHWPSESLKLSDRQCTSLLRSLSELKLFEVSPDAPESWRNTTKGNALACASAAKPLQRITAERRLDEFLSRVNQMNSQDCDFIFWIEEVALFGSMLTNKERVNDVDLCVRLERKVQGEAFSKAAMLRCELARSNGRSFSGVLDQLYWAEQEVRLYLKNRSRAISIVQWDTRWLARTAHRIIYRRNAGERP